MNPPGDDKCDWNPGVEFETKSSRRTADDARALLLALGVSLSGEDYLAKR
jgi:hypothetical protein